MISGSVARRRGEFAVAVSPALGATHRRVIRLVVGEGARLIVLGLQQRTQAKKRKDDATKISSLSHKESSKSKIFQGEQK